MTVSVTPKTQTIVNGTANDGSIVNQMFSDCYTNDATLAAYINAHCALIDSSNTFTATQSFSAKVSFSSTINLAATDPTTPIAGDAWYSSSSNAFEGLIQVATVSGATNASPIVVTTSAAHLLNTGDTVTIYGVLGNTGANGTFVVTVTGPTTFSLNTSTGTGVYTSGGTVARWENFQSTQRSAYPTGYHGSAAPIYASSSTFTQAYIRERNSTDVINITKSTSTTVNTGNTGLNGIAQSANLTGTVSVTASSTTVTFSNSQAGVLQVGDVITTAGGQSRRLASGSGTSWVSESNFTSTETTVTVKRGGKAPNTHYNLYAITDGVTPGLILSTRNVAGGDTLVDLPSGYSYYTQEQFSTRLDGSSNIIPFYTGEGWPYRTKILYQVAFEPMGDAPGPTNVLDGGTQAAYTDLTNVPNFIPPISREAIVLVKMTHTAGARTFVRQNGTSGTDEFGIIVNANSQLASQLYSVPTDSSQLLEYKISGGTTDIDVFGYVVTEVP